MSQLNKAINTLTWPITLTKNTSTILQLTCCKHGNYVWAAPGPGVLGLVEDVVKVDRILPPPSGNGAGVLVKTR